MEYPFPPYPSPFPSETCKLDHFFNFAWSVHGPHSPHLVINRKQLPGVRQAWERGEVRQTWGRGGVRQAGGRGGVRQAWERDWVRRRAKISPPLLVYGPFVYEA